MLAFKWNALIKTIKSDQPRSVSLHTQAVCLWHEWALQPPHFASFQTHAYGRGASFIWCTTFLLPSSGFCLLALCRCCRCCFLGFVFGRGLCSGGGWGRLSWSAGGFGGLCGLWGSVGRMSPTPPFIPSRGRGTPPPAAIVSYRGLQRVITGKQSVTRSLTRIVYFCWDQMIQFYDCRRRLSSSESVSVSVWNNDVRIILYEDILASLFVNNSFSPIKLAGKEHSSVEIHEASFQTCSQQTLTTTLKSSKFLNCERCSCSFGSIGWFFIFEYFKKAQNFSSPYSWPGKGNARKSSFIQCWILGKIQMPKCRGHFSSQLVSKEEKQRGA